MTSPVLEVHDVTVSFGGIHAVSGVSFDLAEGETLGIIGPNGAGKSTLFDLITGYTPPDRGRVVVRGHDVTAVDVPTRVARGLARGFQDAGLYPSMTVRDALSVAVDNAGPSVGLAAALLCTASARTAEADTQARVDELIDLYGLADYAQKFVSEVSTGTRRVVELAAVSAQRPAVLLLDEPSSGIAQREVEALGHLLEATRERLGCALVIIEHDMPLITSISDSILALDRGTFVVRGAPDEVISHPHVVASYLGVDDSTIHRSGVAA